MKISEIITDKYKLRIPPTVYYELLADVREAEEEEEPTTKNELGVDGISRQAVLDLIADYDLSMGQVVRGIHALPSIAPQEPKTGHCRDCKWWKDSDEAFRRGIGAESQCPMNRIEVFEGNGYCYMFEPQESEET